MVTLLRSRSMVGKAFISLSCRALELSADWDHNKSLAVKGTDRTTSGTVSVCFALLALFFFPRRNG